MTSEGDAHEDDEGPPGPLLPPDDRLWRHPSELGAGWSGPPARRLGRPAVSVLTGIVIGAAATTGALTIGSRLASTSSHPTVSSGAAEPDLVTASTALAPAGPSRPRPGPATVGATLTGPADRVAGSLVRLDVSRDAGSVRGAGVAFRADGLVLTTDGLVAGARAVWAVDRQGRRSMATVVGEDPVADIAVVRLAADSAPPAVTGTATPTSGEVVAVVGWVLPAAASGEGPWRPALFMGTVSGLFRGWQEPGGALLLDAVSADAPAGDEAQGAPLVDVQGRLLGLVARPGGADSPTMAVGISEAEAVADELVTSGRAAHGWMGAAAVAHAGGGVQLTAVVPEGPAAEAGLVPGDVILTVDDVSVSSVAELMASARMKRPGQDETLSVVRDGLRRTVTLTLAEAPAQA
ncbi:MAG TPA: S1C family serine protease [Acidimicrobiales bacterium]|nr:S1C family serine protease [Acidimicrobiales bacterium]